MYVSIEETDRVSKMKTRRDRKREKCSKERERLRSLERESQQSYLFASMIFKSQKSFKLSGCQLLANLEMDFCSNKVTLKHGRLTTHPL